MRRFPAVYPKAASQRLEYPGLNLVFPLWDVSRADVFKASEALSIELPDHYAEYPSSLDCLICPSALTTQRRAWMAKRYPEPLAVAELLHAEVTQATLSALNGDNTKNGFAVR